MKSDQEFLEGIYTKAQLLQQTHREEQEKDNITTEYATDMIAEKIYETGKRHGFGLAQTRKRHRMEILAMAAVIAFMVFLPGTEPKQSMRIPEKTAIDDQNQRGMQSELIEEEGILCGFVYSDSGTYYLIKQEQSGQKEEYKILYWYGEQGQEAEDPFVQRKVLYSYVNQSISLDEKQNIWLRQQFSEISNINISEDSITIYPLENLEHR